MLLKLYYFYYFSDRYGTLPVSANQLLQVMELKQLAKKLGFCRIKPENKQHVVLETPLVDYQPYEQ